jgi:hypothetical protein
MLLSILPAGPRLLQCCFPRLHQLLQLLLPSQQGRQLLHSPITVPKVQHIPHPAFKVKPSFTAAAAAAITSYCTVLLCQTL